MQKILLNWKAENYSNILFSYWIFFVYCTPEFWKCFQCDLESGIWSEMNKLFIFHCIWIKWSFVYIEWISNPNSIYNKAIIKIAWFYLFLSYVLQTIFPLQNLEYISWSIQGSEDPWHVSLGPLGFSRTCHISLGASMVLKTSDMCLLDHYGSAELDICLLEHPGFWRPLTCVSWTIRVQRNRTYVSWSIQGSEDPWHVSLGPLGFSRSLTYVSWTIRFRQIPDICLLDH